MNSAAGKPTTGKGSAMNSVISNSYRCNGWLKSEEFKSKTKHPMINDFIPASYLIGDPSDKGK
jgi:hypothetical protein